MSTSEKSGDAVAFCPMMTKRRVIARLAHQQAILRGDRLGDPLRVDGIPARAQARGARHVDGERSVDPAVDPAAIARGLLVAAGEDDDARARGDGAREDLVGERAAGVRGDDDVAGLDGDVGDRARLERDATGESRPLRGDRRGDL